MYCINLLAIFVDTKFFLGEKNEWKEPWAHDFSHYPFKRWLNTLNFIFLLKIYSIRLTIWDEILVNSARLKNMVSLKKIF